MDSEDRTRREQERAMRERERLKFRLYAAVRDLTLASELFRTHYQLHEPEVTVGVYERFVDVCVALTEGQLRLLPAAGRSKDLVRFAEELRVGVAKVAAELGLDPPSGPDPLGLSGPVTLLATPIGYRAVLPRRPGA